MAIEIICGLPGHGKGCLAVDRIFRDLHRDPKIVVYCNFPVYSPGTMDLHPRIKFFDTWADIRGAANGIIYLDEAQRWFSSRAFKDNHPEDLEFFQEHRHNGLSLRMICQHPGQLDVDIRDRLCAYVWYVKRIWGPDQHTEGPSKIEKRIGWLAKCRKFTGMEFKSAKRTALASYTIDLRDYHDLYDTYWLVGSREGKGTGYGKALRRQAERDAGPDVVTLLNGETLTREQYFSRMQQVAKGDFWRYESSLDDITDAIFGKGQATDGISTNEGPAVGVLLSNGLGRGKADGVQNGDSSARVARPHRTVYKLG